MLKEFVKITAYTEPWVFLDLLTKYSLSHEIPVKSYVREGTPAYQSVYGIYPMTFSLRLLSQHEYQEQNYIVSAGELEEVTTNPQ